jgi:hypothetical protein
MEQRHHRLAMSNATWRGPVKKAITALALATLIVSPALAQSYALAGLSTGAEGKLARLRFTARGASEALGPYARPTSDLQERPVPDRGRKRSPPS